MSFVWVKKTYIKPYHWKRLNMTRFIESVTTENKIDIRNLSWFNMKSFAIRNYFDPKWKLYTFIMGFTMHEKKTPVPSDAGCEIQSFVGLLNFIRL